MGSSSLHSSVAVNEPPASPPTFSEAFRFWLKLGFISFGGPTGQIAIMHEELVERKKWISEEQFLHALNYCMLLPGPEATQLATYAGWLLHKTWGGIVAGVLFVLPSAIILWVLSLLYVMFGKLAWATAIFYGLKAAVLGIVAAAALRLGRRALQGEFHWMLAALAFAAIWFFKAPFPLIVFSAGFIGWLGGKLWPEQFRFGGEAKVRTETVSASKSGDHIRPSMARAIRVVTICLMLWWTPVFFLGGWLGWNHAVPQEGLFFSKAALVTFGGAYAVLPYVSQQAVNQHGWLSAAQMMDGLGLAETTPGPLIMVLQFVGFLGGWQHPGSLSPLLAATLGAFITTWTTFVPCFLWIFLGAPHLEQLRGHAGLNAALSAVTAAVVGVILNLAVWFGRPILFPESGGVDWFVAAVAGVAFAGLVKWKWNLIAVILGAGLLGLVYRGWLFKG